MEFSWGAAFYASLGAGYPRLSLVIVVMLFALLGGGCWKLLERNYREQKASIDAAKQYDQRIELRLKGIEDGQIAQAKRLDAEAHRRKDDDDRKNAQRTVVGKVISEAGPLEAEIFAKNPNIVVLHSDWVTSSRNALSVNGLASCAQEFEYPEHSSGMSFGTLTREESAMVIDVRDRVRALRRCLAALGG